MNKLKGDQGIWQEGTSYLSLLISQYEGLFSIEIDGPYPCLLEKVNARVTMDTNEALLKPYTPEVVKKHIFLFMISKLPL